MNLLEQSDICPLNWEASGATLPEGNSIHSWFSLVRNTPFIYCWMSKGTPMVRTSVEMLKFRPINTDEKASDTNTQQSELIPFFICCSHLRIGDEPSSEKQREMPKLYCCRRQHFQRGVSCSLDSSQVQFL